MKYSFKSVSVHHYKNIIVRYLPRLIWPLVITGAVQYFFPDSYLAKNHLHLYLFLAAAVFTLYSLLTSDSINKIEVDQQHQIIRFYYYNIYQGQMQESVPFDTLKVHIEEAGKNNVYKIGFRRKKMLLFTLTKQKDRFSQQDLNDLKVLLYRVGLAKQS